MLSLLDMIYMGLELKTSEFDIGAGMYINGSDA